MLLICVPGLSHLKGAWFSETVKFSPMENQDSKVGQTRNSKSLHCFLTNPEPNFLFRHLASVQSTKHSSSDVSEGN